MRDKEHAIKRFQELGAVVQSSLGRKEHYVFEELLHRCCIRSQSLFYGHILPHTELTSW